MEGKKKVIDTAPCGHSTSLQRQPANAAAQKAEKDGVENKKKASCCFC